MAAIDEEPGRLDVPVNDIAYGVTDTDGSKPDCWGYLAAYGWEREDGEGIDRFR